MKYRGEGLDSESCGVSTQSLMLSGSLHGDSGCTNNSSVCRYFMLHFSVFAVTHETAEHFLEQHSFLMCHQKSSFTSVEPGSKGQAGLMAHILEESCAAQEGPVFSTDQGPRLAANCEAQGINLTRYTEA